MLSDTLVYILAVILNAGNLFLQVFFAVMYSDLEADFVNPIELCNKLNVYLLPEAGLQAFITLLLLLSGQWLALLLNAPIVAWNVRKFLNNNFMLDATEIFRTVHGHKKETFAKIAFHLVLFFFYLYSMIVCLVRD